MMKHKIFTVLILGTLLLPQSLFAAGLSLSVSPTLFEMSAVPLQAWNSSVKVINNNPQDITVYANVVNFAPQGETGQGKFLPVFEDFTEGKTLAEWITVSEEPYVIPRESSVAVPLTINVPEDASPGGHYAAIMIGTRPLNSDNPFQVKTAQIVTSLFFVRVAGDIIEKGNVRTFRTEKTFFDVPEVDFEVRFENKGNVHLQPQGEIVITNMWGKERGIVPINHQTHFGNVLPESIRQFNFTWKGEQSFTDIGRYTAVLTLAYGQDVRNFVTQPTYFWVIPVKAVLMVLGSLAAIIFLLTWSIRTYVRKMLSMSGVQEYVPRSQRFAMQGDVVIESRPSVRAPLLGGVKDLQSRLSKTHAFLDTVKTLFSFVLTYKKFFVSALLLIVASLAVWYFLIEVTTLQRDYEVTIENPDTSVTLSSEEIIYEKNSASTPQVEEVSIPAAEVVSQDFELILINSSDTPGVAAAMQTELESQGYAIEALKSDFEESKKHTVIVYDIAIQEDARVLSKLLDGALLSARPDDLTTSLANISVFIGNDHTESQ
ncbi:MAG: hypothetical protein ACI92I_000031 [Acidimicrobiales bacterium]|jgi:hypothetical protein